MVVAREASFSKTISPEAFARGPLGRFGNSNRRFFHGPGLANADLALHKTTRITEKAALEFRAEFFNAFNHPNLGIIHALAESGGSKYLILELVEGETLAQRIDRGPIPVKLSEHGEMLDFPVTPELRAENPPVTSNQPKGTLSLQAIVRIRFSGNLTEKLSWYEEALRQANAAARSQAGLAGLGAPKAKTLAFATGTNQSVTIKTAAGEMDVHLGPAWYIENQEMVVTAGDKVEVKGSKVDIGGKPAIIAAELTKGDETMVLRDGAGVPVWAGWRRR